MLVIIFQSCKKENKIISNDNILSNFNSPQHLESYKYNVCGKEFMLEEAITDVQRAKGLMFREPLANGKGMIFLFNSSSILSFWMKNVSFDIDILYFDENKKLINFHTMKGTSVLQSTKSLPSYKSSKKAKYAIEISPHIAKLFVEKKCSFKKI